MWSTLQNKLLQLIFRKKYFCNYSFLQIFFWKVRFFLNSFSSNSNFGNFDFWNCQHHGERTNCDYDRGSVCRSITAHMRHNTFWCDHVGHVVRSNDDDVCHLSLFVNLSVSCEHLAATNRRRSTIESRWNSRIQPFFLLSFLFSFLFLLNFRCITASADQQVFAKRFFSLSPPRRTLPPERTSHWKGRVSSPHIDVHKLF